MANAAPRPMSAEEKKVIFASSLGTVFEWYDFYLYGSLAAIIAKQFFSGLDEGSAFIFALLAFADEAKPGAAAALAGLMRTALGDHAAMAVASGQCHTVLCVAGQNLLTNKSRASAVQTMAESGAAHPQFESPYGLLVASNYALIAQRPMQPAPTSRWPRPRVRACRRPIRTMP